ncbi:hypothetical protein NGB36_30310 [Streptomyces sp. RB6PN25]|uniref:Integral membrane protein n=1 Tax=Streptomyces humicola TaxID=2953240 RepID=A0ABT1Q494_9ACTN|nr:DMT family transporter [Streptomyces humicola]MCQ4084751.1 hypothetical protein [Streptomyces humicola]
MIGGLALALLSAACYNVGILVEKVALTGLPPLRVRDPVALFRTLFGRPLWLGGFLLMLLGLVCQVTAMSLLPITVAQPMLAAGPAVVVAGSAVVLKEPLGRSDYLGLAAIGCSLVMLGLSYDPSQERVGHGRHPAEVLTVAALSCAAALVVFAVAGRSARGVVYGTAVGLLNGVGGLLGKASSAVIASDGRHPLQAVLTTPYPYLFGVLAVVMLGAMQIALQRSRAAIMVPAQVVVGNLHVMVTGTLIFGERLPADPVRLALRLAGLAVSLSVLALLQRSPERARQEPEPERVTVAP